MGLKVPKSVVDSIKKRGLLKFGFYDDIEDFVVDSIRLRIEKLLRLKIK
jgi:hypothetical protein